jgi:hypothetical protein
MLFTKQIEEGEQKASKPWIIKGIRTISSAHPSASDELTVITADKVASIQITRIRCLDAIEDGRDRHNGREEDKRTLYFELWVPWVLRPNTGYFGCVGVSL